MKYLITYSMRSEDSVPVDERFLVLEGFLSPTALSLASAGLPPSKPEHTEAFFVSYAYADLPVGKEFQIIFQKNDPEKVAKTTAKIIAVTQQFAKRFDEIPAGWKTICYIQFPSGIPEIVKRLPIIDERNPQPKSVCVSSNECWLALKNKSIK